MNYFLNVCPSRVVHRSFTKLVRFRHVTTLVLVLIRIVFVLMLSLLTLTILAWNAERRLKTYRFKKDFILKCVQLLSQLISYFSLQPETHNCDDSLDSMLCLIVNLNVYKQFRSQAIALLYYMHYTKSTICTAYNSVEAMAG